MIEVAEGYLGERAALDRDLRLLVERLPHLADCPSERRVTLELIAAIALREVAR